MLPASNSGVGMNIGLPDVCLTPSGPAVVPVPYPNVALNAQAVGASPNVILTGCPALNLGSVIPMTSGDEAGVAHPTIKGASTFTTGNTSVLVNGLPAIDLTAPTTGNNMNDGLGMQAVPSVTNVFYALAGADLAACDARLPRDGAAVTRALVDGAVGVVTIRWFSIDVPARVVAAIEALEADGADRLVMDLRGNGGGEVAAAIALAGELLDDGALIAALRDEDGDDVHLRASGAPLTTLPIEVLVDGATASAAELFAGSLAAHGRATLAGARTYGKGTARSASGRRCIVVLPDGTAFDGEGLTPD
ncbi:MAG TPA: PAAR-like domain-containing protein [Byssovorax sp.]|jgi:carboxyl-terminal processing protease